MFNMSAVNPNPAPQMGGQMMGNQMPSSGPMPQPSMGQAPMPSYAHGGKVKKAAMTLAHMSPHELNILDHLQGGTERHNKSGIRSYSHLEELFKNPHLREQFHHHAAEHHAMGGEAGEDGHDMCHGGMDHMSQGGMEHLKQDGRHGDTEMALIGPQTHHFFNQMAGQSTRNPHDGHPEYWSLGGALSGLAKGIKGGASAIGRGAMAAGRGAYSLAKRAAPTLGAIGQAATPALANIASEHLQKHLGDSGGMLGQLGGALGNAAFGKMAGQGKNPIGTYIGEGLGKFATAAHNGEGMRSAIGQGLSHTGMQFGNDNATGNIMSSVGQGLQNGQNAGQIGRAVGAHALQGGMNALNAGPGNRRSALLPTAGGMHAAAQHRLQEMQELPFAGGEQYA